MILQWIYHFIHFIWKKHSSLVVFTENFMSFFANSFAIIIQQKDKWKDFPISRKSVIAGTYQKVTSFSAKLARNFSTFHFWFFHNYRLAVRQVEGFSDFPENLGSYVWREREIFQREKSAKFHNDFFTRDHSFVSVFLSSSENFPIFRKISRVET